MHDPLYDLSPSDPEWEANLIDEVDDLHTALVQGDYKRAARKARELRNAFDKMAL